MRTAIQTKDNKTIYRVSRWIKINHTYNPHKNNGLWYYVRDGYGYAENQDGFNPKENGGLFLDWFSWNGRKWALEQFLRLSYPIFYEDKEGKLNYLSGYDGENYYNPILIEIDEYCEYIRVYEE